VIFYIMTSMIVLKS